MFQYQQFSYTDENVSIASVMPEKNKVHSLSCFSYFPPNCLREGVTAVNYSLKKLVHR